MTRVTLLVLYCAIWIENRFYYLKAIRHRRPRNIDIRDRPMTRWILKGVFEND